MSTLPKWLQLQTVLTNSGLAVFSTQDFRRLTNLPETEVKYYLRRLTELQVLVNLKKGLYALKSQLPGDEELAARLYRPSYLSFEYALNKYNILPEAPYAVTSATTKPTREFIVENKVFTYATIKRSVFCGYVPQKIDGGIFYVAEPEKALLDYLYFVALGKKTLNNRLNTRGLNLSKIARHLKDYHHPRLTTLVSKIL